MCVCGLSVVLQMAVLNCYHMYPLRRVPRWIRKVEACLYCIGVRIASREKLTASSMQCTRCGTKPAQPEKLGKPYETKSGSNRESRLERSIQQGVDIITQKILSDTEEAMLRQEWVDAARLFDRLLFLTFCFVHLFMILLIFVILPLVWLLMPRTIHAMSTFRPHNSITCLLSWK